jgi:hypothetical protein
MRAHPTWIGRGARNYTFGVRADRCDYTHKKQPLHVIFAERTFLTWLNACYSGG